MGLSFTQAVAPLVILVAVATAALTSVMQASTVFMMVLPSMVVFAVVAFVLGMQFGEFDANGT